VIAGKGSLHQLLRCPMRVVFPERRRVLNADGGGYLATG